MQVIIPCHLLILHRKSIQSVTQFQYGLLALSGVLILLCQFIQTQLTLFCIVSDVNSDTVLRKGGGTPQLAEVKRVRSLFPETWIWLEDDAK